MTGGTGPYAGYVLASYLAAFLILGSLGLWIVLGGRAARRASEALDDEIRRADLTQSRRGASE